MSDQETGRKTGTNGLPVPDSRDPKWPPIGNIGSSEQALRSKVGTDQQAPAEPVLAPPTAPPTAPAVTSGTTAK